MSDSSETLVKQRLQKGMNFLKKKTSWIAYALLAVIIYIAVWIRTRNLGGLRDITTGGWTLGPDLDPFLFLRWAKYIVEHGSLFAMDVMRYVPLGFDTGTEYPFLANSIAWFHKLAVAFGSTSVEQSAVFYPVFMFAITVVAFFFMTRAAFSYVTDSKKSNAIALVASLFLSILPSFIPRTIAGIPEKEAAAFLFFFMAFFFFLKSWKKEDRFSYLYAGLAGLFTGIMALTWGGFAYVLLILDAIILIMFLFGQTSTRKTIGYFMLVGIMYLLAFSFSDRFTMSGIFNSIEGVFTLITVAVVGMDMLVHRTRLSKYTPKFLRNHPRVTSIFYGIIALVLIGAIIFGPSFVLSNLSRFYQIVQPSSSRLIQTVAENRQPFFVEWAPSFGPALGGIQVLFVIIFAGSILLFHQAIKKTNLVQRERNILTAAWVLFISALTFTRYSPQSIFNGSSFVSIASYFLGMLLIFVAFAYVNSRSNKRGETNPYSGLGLGVVFILVFFAIGLFSARSFIRLVLMLVPIASIIIAYVLVVSVNRIYLSSREKRIFTIGNLICLAAVIMIIFAGYAHYKGSVGLAQSYIPSAYNQQWQKAMAWVRDSTPSNAVFAHWWDYGYWIQSIGERATVLDGGNFLGYWNHLMGRHGLTDPTTKDTLEFFYAHNVTHYLIDSTDIGKYGAFSSIGSDANYDRRSWIPAILKDGAQTVERKNSSVFVYPSGVPLDQDIIHGENETIFLPADKSYLAAVAVTVDKNTNEIQDVFAIFFYQDKTHQIPLRYYWDESSGLVDTGKGVDAGVFILPRVGTDGQGVVNIDPRGAMLYLSPRTVHSNLARFYLYGEEDSSFRLVHSEDDFIISSLKAQGAPVGEFVYYNELRGPMKIWEVTYPSNIRFNDKYLQTEYPAELLLA